MIKNICVLGGGSSGFLTAAMLAKYVKNNNLDLKIKCVYSSKIGIIGVGESTQLSINDAFRFLEWEDEEWMSECKGTYKTNIAFESWSNPGEQFFYPFGHMDNEGNNVFFDLLNSFPDEIDKTQFARFCLGHSRFAELNRLTDKDWNFDCLTAYHFDTHLLSKILLRYCIEHGVEMVDDEYTSSHQNENGIEYINCKETGSHHADLFVDCTGFKSLLLGKELNVPYKTYSNTLINNKALICKAPYVNKDEQLKSFTNNVTMRNGWCWEIPLWDGMSLGYVHSTKFESEDQIREEFETFVRDRYGSVPEEIRTLDFTTGRYEDGWVKNVVAVGLSYGFIEPLESTGIHLGINNMYRLLEILSSQKTINAFDKKLYNHAVADEMDLQKGFIDMHYASAHRCDTDYWKFIVNDNNYDWTERNLKSSLDITILERNYSNNFHGGLPYILTGNGYGPYNPGLVKKDNPDMSKVLRKDQWLKRDKQLTDRVLQCKTTAQFLEDKIYSS